MSFLTIALIPFLMFSSGSSKNRMLSSHLPRSYTCKIWYQDGFILRNLPSNAAVVSYENLPNEATESINGNPYFDESANKWKLLSTINSLNAASRFLMYDLEFKLNSETKHIKYETSPERLTFGYNSHGSQTHTDLYEFAPCTTAKSSGIISLTSLTGYDFKLYSPSNNKYLSFNINSDLDVETECTFTSVFDDATTFHYSFVNSTTGHLEIEHPTYNTYFLCINASDNVVACRYDTMLSVSPIDIVLKGITKGNTEQGTGVFYDMTGKDRPTFSFSYFDLTYAVGNNSSPRFSFSTPVNEIYSWDIANSSVNIPLIVLNGPSSNMDIGDTFNLSWDYKSSYLEANPPTYSSSNPGVATVDETGLLTAVSSGTTTIAITTPKGIYDSLVVTVNGSSGGGDEPGPGSSSSDTPGSSETPGSSDTSSSTGSSEMDQPQDNLTDEQATKIGIGVGVALGVAAIAIPATVIPVSIHKKKVSAKKKKEDEEKENDE